MLTSNQIQPHSPPTKKIKVTAGIKCTDLKIKKILLISALSVVAKKTEQKIIQANEIWCYKMEIK